MDIVVSFLLYIAEARSHMKGHLPCAEHVKSPFKLTKYYIHSFTRMWILKYKQSIERFCDATFGQINSQNVVIVCLVAPTHLKHISQTGNFPQIGVKTNNIWNHQL